MTHQQAKDEVIAYILGNASTLSQEALQHVLSCPTCPAEIMAAMPAEKVDELKRLLDGR